MSNQVGVMGAPGGLATEVATALQVRVGTAWKIEAIADGGQWAAGSQTFESMVYVGAAPSRNGPPLTAHAEASLTQLRDRPPRQLVVISNAAAYPPSAHHPGMADESLPFSPRGANTISQAWQRVESLALQLSDVIPTIQVLRPPPVLTPGGNDYFSQLLRGPFAAVVPGFNPPLQFMSLSDLAGAVAACLEARGPGTSVYNLAPADVIPMRKALALAKTRVLPIPRWLQAPIRTLGSAAGWCWPLEQLDYLRHNWTVSGRRAQRELGLAPAQSSGAVLEAFLGRGAGLVSATRFDDFGMDRERIEELGRTWFKFLHDRYWRIETIGLERVPKQGAALLVGLHRGFMPFDGIMMLHASARWRGRFPRFLVHPGLLKAPFSSRLITTLGGIPARRENAERILAGGSILGVFPEGVRGAFAPYREAQQLLRFDPEFVRLALQFQAPVIPFVTLGSAETFPILACVRSSWLRRTLEWPCFPITPTFPMLPLPLPSKWHTWVLPPLEVAGRFPADAARDDELVRALAGETRRRMHEALQWMVGRRTSWFHGQIFSEGEPDLGDRPPTPNGAGSVSNQSKPL